MKEFDRVRIAETRKVLAERFPAAFMRKGGPTKLPLKVGIRDDVLAAVPDLNPTLVRRAIGDYVTGPKYARAMVAGAVRFDLQGMPAGVVTEEEAKYAQSREYRRRQKSREHFRKLEKAKQQATEVAA